MRRLIQLLTLCLLLWALPTFGADEFAAATGSYTGDGADNRTITISPSFTPKFVMIRATGSSLHTYVNFSCTDLAMELANLTTGAANKIQACGSGSFQIGSHADTNTNGSTYHYLALGDGPSLEVGSYSGNGADDRTITMAKSFTPGLLMIRCNDAGGAARGVFRTTTHTGDSTSYFHQLANTTNLIQSVSAGSFQVGSAAAVNVSSQTCYYLAIEDLAGLTDSFSYSGNNTDNRTFTDLGFQPDAFVLLKDTSADSPWAFRFGIQTGDAGYIGIAAQAANGIQQFTASGFEVGTNVGVNGNTYTYYAWGLKAPTITSTAVRKNRVRIFP